MIEHVAPAPTACPRLGAALAGHVVERYHDRHRHDLEALKGLVGAWPATPPALALARHRATFAANLERHMLKDERRLFPMVEQGNNALIGMTASLDKLLESFLADLADHAALEEQQLFAPFANAPRRPR